ncbi:type II toxin-antitoxin system PemK/MazF family toxin [Sandarakinorhabdus sp.]|uniref:type II toxin-antitoxin system PemK/MazF family toxin n=1 Tax=Sandarakinorhabdus sp. TaxID=1916663 RepID=UPI00334165C3
MTASDGLAFGDILLVPFPFTNQAASKQRPAVVISRSDVNSARPDVIVMAITSQLTGFAHSYDVLVMQWQAAGLLKPSAIKAVIATLERSLIIRKLGSLQPDDRVALSAAIGLILGA